MASDRGDYDQLGVGYAALRRPDMRILRQVRGGLEGSSSLLNVGAGMGAYEPQDVHTVSIEPSVRMIGQRARKGLAVRGVAEMLPFADRSFDSTLAVLTIHHWRDVARGLDECARVSRSRVTILTWDPESPGFWLTQRYFPEILALDREIFPTMATLRRSLGEIRVETVPIPAECTDGFLGAYWRRPLAYLRTDVRSGMSSFSRVDVDREAVCKLEEDLRSGCWQREFGHLLTESEQDLGYRLVTAVLP